VSSRTYAIAYDTLTAIRSRIRRLARLHVINAIDRVRVFIGSRFVRVVATVLVVVISLSSFRQWLHNGKFSDLAPELIASLIALIFAWARR